ncbi:MAG TPA: tyrosine-type recombinase/integrase [Azospirillum sp.]
MQAKITKRLVDSLATEGERLYVWDTDLKGFGLIVTPNGVKTYVVKYRMGGGRGAPTKRHVLGRHGTLTADKARDMAHKALAGVRNGIDPAAERRAEREGTVTVTQLADRYLEQHVEAKNKASTAAEFRRLLDKHVKPAIGRLAVDKVTRADIAKLHHDMRDTPRSANQTLAVLSKMFGLAEVWGLRPDESNPCRRIEKYRENKRERFLSDAEVAEIGEVLTQLEGTEQASVLNAVRLLLLTGCRLGEVLALRWEDVDLAAGALVIRDAKAGGRLHAIGAQTIAFLAEQQKGKGWVLPSLDPEKPLPKSTLIHAWSRVREAATVAVWRDRPDTPAGALVAELERQVGKVPTYAACQEAATKTKTSLPAGLTDVRLHDLRHTVGTYAGQAGANAFLVRDKLGHKTLAMTGRYVNRDANPLRELSDKVENRIAAALRAKAGGVAAEGITPLPVRRAR